VDEESKDIKSSRIIHGHIARSVVCTRCDGWVETRTVTCLRLVQHCVTTLLVLGYEMHIFVAFSPVFARLAKAKTVFNTLL